MNEQEGFGQCAHPGRTPRTVAFTAIREANAITAKARKPANSNITLKHDKEKAKDSTSQGAQDTTALKVMPINQQVENIKMQHRSRHEHQ